MASQRLLRSLVFGLVAAWIAVAPAVAELRVDIPKGTTAPIPIAITPFVGQGPDGARFGQDIARVVSADLERSGLFRPIDPAAFTQTPEAIGISPRFADWRVINAQGLVAGSVKGEGGQLSVEFRLWDVLAEQMVEGQVLGARIDGWRRIAHKISDAIYKRVTGEDGYFDTQIVYVAESGPATNRIKQLAIMDQDGAGVRTLTDPRVLALTPRFSPTRREITYMSYFNNKPRVYLFDLTTGRQEVVGDFPGMTFAPRFSPDGDRVIMSLASGGKTDIWTMDLRTRKSTRLTSSGAIDTSPSYSPDGQRIVFNSDRGGSQQLYVMNADGSNVQRISFAQGRYATPVWSPRGDLIAFTRMGGGKFQIGVMRPDGQGERLLSESFGDEGPTWSPNGRVLMFFRQSPSDAQGRGKGVHLVSVDITGANMRELVTATDASDPAWSPLIP